MPHYTYSRVVNRTFVNPYNFVKLGTDCNKTINYFRAKEASDAVSGWLECELELKSPIFIPNSSNDKFFGQWHQGQNDELKSYEFYSYDNLKNTNGNQQPHQPENPVIPGSEIRGMIRSAYEALTNSCLSTIDPKMSFHKRAPKSDKSGKPGILRKNGTGWEIVPCIRYMLKTSPCFHDPFEFNPPYTQIYTPPYTDWPAWREHMADLEKNDRKVWIQPSARYRGRPYMDCLISKFEERLTPRLIQGYVHVTAHFTKRKHHDSVFVENGLPPIPISQEEAENYLENLKLCKGHVTFGSEYEHLYKGDNIGAYDNVCVYYTEYHGKKYLSPSMINREMLYTRLGDRIGHYTPCNDPKKLCPACSLFGMVSDKGSVSSRLRFSDALPIEGTTEFQDPVLLEELASPKPSASEFYLERPDNPDNQDNQDNWNYDYQMTWGNGNIANIANVTPYTGRIRGRKFYWHHKDMKLKISSLLTDTQLSSEQKKKLLRMCLVRPLKKGKFTFRVYFDRVTLADIDNLVYIMTIGFSADHAHKIGMGKPLGLGSVQIKVSKLSRRIFDSSCTRVQDDIDYTLDAIRNQIISNCVGRIPPDILEQFKALTMLNSHNNISYPYVIKINNNNETRLSESFKWFVGNRQINGHANKPIVDKTLPPPTNPDQQVIQELD